MAAHTLTTINHPLHSFTQSFISKNINPQTIRFKQTTTFTITSALRAAVIGGGPAGSSAAEALASGGIETFIFERSPEAAKPCGGAIPLCMLDEFSIPSHLIDRKVTQMKIISPSNLTVDFGKTLKPHEFISMVRREVLDDFLRRRAVDCGATLVKALVTNIELPISEKSPYIIHYNSNNTRSSLAVDVIIGADGANSKVAKSIDAGDYTCAIAFQERIKLPDDKMKYYENLAEMYVGSDVSPDFYAWVFPKCDHVAVGTGTISSKQNIKQFQGAIRNRAKPKIEGGKVIKVEAHPIPEHPRPIRVRGRVALVGDAAGYVTKCSGEGIYFAAKSGRMCGEAIVRASGNGKRMIGEGDLKREYLRKWDDEFFCTFKFLDVLQRVFYGSNAGLEALVELCDREYVQRMTFESYLYKKMARGNPAEDVKMAAATVGSFIRCSIVGREMADYGRSLLKM
ncbi:Pyridine nucleotide-disulfide oxidoreductase family protein [Perilla frutescens var. hirtella]|uniref:Geranylgeranyl diphosphate reductase, chloroplastic n=1 Tax=Perilla frutescens var. hirtella TaxID=608512 RepID=A0AAD4P3D1_PERFH|nr:Pyridine nucleotide-disulfide oxidoreductase family protein [Perilla frutescens var. frutescens]KAH6784830.1 Pyridine nucleotide-disulfide oxidoreductase family protein [Perilla frutescens var. hirtella]KAH6824577.1 Pyridine nucleotide-disulfide oxidoreductase family protein [Perilla frutescens var. hirtella]